MSVTLKPFNLVDSPAITYQKVTGQSEPRCSLDFRIFIDDKNIIDDSKLRLQSFQGQDQLSQPFEYQLVLRANDFTAGSLEPEFIGNQIKETAKANEQSYGEILNPAYQQTLQLNFNDVIGANATIMLGTPETDNDVREGKYPSGRPVVYFNGIISNFALAERGVYHASLKPALFKLSLQNKYRVFTNQTILDVVKSVLDENSIEYNKDALESNQPKIVCGLANYRKQDWLQAGESDLDFITRLMGKVNLFYYFTHDENSHTMVMTDQPYYQTIYKREINDKGFNAETTEIKSLYLSYTKQDSADRDDYIENFKFQQNLTTSGVTTILAQKEAVWESQNTSQASPVFHQREYQKEKLNMEHMHTVQYGASWEEVDKMTNTEINKLNASKFDFSGASSCAEMKAGHKFLVLETYTDATSKKYSSPLPIRPELDNQEFVVTSVQHQASAEGDYKNQFSAVLAAGLATPSNPHGISQGSIIGQVTEKPTTKTISSSNVSFDTYDETDTASTEQSHTGSSAKQLEKSVFTFDLNQFQYQIDGTEDTFDCTGVYVRFIDQPDDAAPVWIKLSEHMQTIPEVGVYVVVSRSSDDNEIPEIQQMLQAKGSKVIMPQGYTSNTNVGDSYNTGYGDSTSISFGADVTTSLATAQKIVNTQRDSGNYNDVRYGESASYGYNVSAHSHNLSLTGSGTGPVFNPSDLMKYVQYNHSITNGDVYSKSEMNGDTTSSSVTTGNTNSTSEQTGDITSSNTVTGNTDNTSVNNGNITSNNTTNGDTDSTSEQTGNSTSSNTVHGDTSNSSKNYGKISNTSVHHGFNNSASTHSGMQNSASNMNGMQNSASNTNGNINSATNFNGVNNSVNIMLGMENSASTKTGVFLSANNVNGIQKNASLITGSSFDYTMVTGSKDSKTIIGGVWIEQRDAAVKKETDAILAWAKDQMSAAKTGTDTTATDSTVETTAAENKVKTSQADNSVASTTAKNTVSNVSAGTDTSNNTSVQTKMTSAPETEIATMKTIL